MVQLRWIERPTGKTIMDNWGYYQPELERVLQFRQERDKIIYSGAPGETQHHRETHWTDWQDVPVVTEMEQA